ncbi:CPSF A subunit region-domain-containing protein [Catenaria anguillulae PL171]|uniref:CPSF A subunit region-domain-containing protein n=1 Tax=Catenaria anguillulae PL171 TaxID=765915 RepID=A0A1Y2HZA0_9FUNG|nr:CPSF A subunit region-domain-containing protein [Catenaria anguillulae PL171]
MSVTTQHSRIQTFNPLLVTASPPSSVSHSAKGSLTHPRDTNLVVCKCSALDVFRLTPRGIVPVCSERLFARIALLHLFRPAGRSTDLLLLVSDKFQFAILAWDPAKNQLVTLHAGSLEERAGRKLDDQAFAFVDPRARLVGLVLYQGLLSVVPLSDMGKPKDSSASALPVLTSANNTNTNNKGKGKAKATPSSSTSFSASSTSTASSLVPSPSDVPARFTLRMQELNVLSLYVKGDRHLRTYTISTRDKELVAGPMEQVLLSKSAHLLVPLQSGGVLKPVKSPACKLARDAKIKTYSFVDPDQLLVGDLVGNYTLVHVARDGAGKVELNAYYMGSTTTCTTLTYIDAGYTYLGSHYGDSALIRLLEAPLPSGSMIQTIDTYANLGPISDFILMDSPGSSGGVAPQLVTCSGAFHNGSLRVVRHGIEIAAHAHVPMPPVPSRVVSAPPVKDAPGIVFVSLGTTATVALSMTGQGDIVEVPEASGVVTHQVTLAAAWMARGKVLVQVTSAGVYVFKYSADGGTFTGVATWAPDTEGRGAVGLTIQHAVVVPEANVVVVAVQAGIVQLHIDTHAGHVDVVHQERFEADIASLDVNAERGIAAVALWNRDVYVYFWSAAPTSPAGKAWARAMPDPIALAEYEARSIVVAHWGGGGAPATEGAAAGTTYLLCGRGDGNIVAFLLDPVTRGVRAGVPRLIGVGTEPVRLTKFSRAGKLHVESGKLVYSNVNLSHALHVTCMPVRTAEAAAADGDDDDPVVVGVVENVHVATYPLGGEMPRRIAHHAPTRSIVVLTERLDDSAPLDAYAEEQAFVKVYDEVTMECCMCLHRLVGDKDEAEALGGGGGQDEDDDEDAANPRDANLLVAVGTAYVIEGEEEPTRGRILLFKINSVDKSLVLVSSTTVKGAVYSLASLGAAAPGKLVAGINNRVVLFDTMRASSFPRLSAMMQPAITAARTIVAATPLATPEVANAVPALNSNCSHAGFIMALFLEVHGNLIVVGDLMKSVAVLEYTAATNSLSVVAKDPSPSWVTAVAAIDEDHALVADTEHNDQAAMGSLKPRLEIPAEIHTGEFINRFRAGHLRPAADEAKVVPRFISASVNGHLGIVLIALNSVLSERVLAVGEFKYEEWRRFHSPRKVIAMHGAVDGDLVQRFAEFERECKREGELTVEEVARLVRMY